MSMNRATNAVIALIENRTDLAKEIFRGPGSDIKNIPELMARLDRAVNKAAVTAFRNALKRSLALQPDDQQLKAYLHLGEKQKDPKAGIEAAFYYGVDKVERLMESIAEELEQA